MRKIISTCLLLLMLCSLAPVKAQAATTNIKAGAVTTAGGNLNVRSDPTTNSAVLTTLKKGSHIMLISKEGVWWKVAYGKNQYGYCHSDYITIIQGTPAAVATRSSNLNVRTGPGTSYAVRAQLAKGETVLRFSSQNGWSRILYHGTQIGYVSDTYLSGGGAVLSVPDFKQMDSRWANVKLGSSGKTISQIGCATTAIAMMESYRTGATIYPDAMAKRLTYTSTGSVYWPSHFTAVTNGTNYLSRIAGLLAEGKPVLLGAKNSTGKQHWVVITGYNGEGLSPLNFTINDPGSTSRTNLSLFLNLYPNFYKYFHY